MTYPTTLRAIRERGPCRSGWMALLAKLGKSQADDEPLAWSTILDNNGLDDALWCLRVMPSSVITEAACLMVEPALNLLGDTNYDKRHLQEILRRVREGRPNADDAVTPTKFGVNQPSTLVYRLGMAVVYVVYTHKEINPGYAADRVASAGYHARAAGEYVLAREHIRLAQCQRLREYLG